MSLIWRKVSFLLTPDLGLLVHLTCLKKHSGFAKRFIDVQQSVAYVQCSVHIEPDKHMGSQPDAFDTHPSCCARIHQLHDALPVSSELGCLSHCFFSWPPPLSAGKDRLSCCLPARQIGENQPSWLEVSSPDQGIQSCPLRLFLLGVVCLWCTLTPAPCDSKGKNRFTVVYSGEKWWCHISTLSSICHLAAGKRCLAFLLCSQVLQYFPQRYKKVQMLIIEATHVNLAWNWLHSCSFKIF